VVPYSGGKKKKKKKVVIFSRKKKRDAPARRKTSPERRVVSAKEKNRPGRACKREGNRPPLPEGPPIRPKRIAKEHKLKVYARNKEKKTSRKKKRVSRKKTTGASN